MIAASPSLLSPGPSAWTLAASWDGSTFILKGLMGICCLNIECDIFCFQDTGGGKRNKFTCVLPHLVSKQHHDGVLASARWCVLHSECIIVILDDVKVNVGLSRTDHSWSTLDSNADITCRSDSINLSDNRRTDMEMLDCVTPCPASLQSTVKYVGSFAFRPVFSTPGP